MKTFKRPAPDYDTIAEQCEIYKAAMHKHLLAQYYGRITKEEAHAYFKSLIEEQDEMGFWGFVKPREVTADIRVYYLYEPTYIAVATMMFYWCTTHEEAKAIEGFEASLKKGLEAAIGREFKGSGYDEVLGIAHALKYFAYGKVDTFVEHYPDLYYRFTNQYRAAKYFLGKLIKEGKTKNAWGDEFKEPIEEALTLLEETTDPCIRIKPEEWIGVFVYGTLMEGQRNHNRYMLDGLFEGDYYLKDYANYQVEYFPGIVPLKESQVIGELYLVRRDHIKKLDRLEQEGFLYKRQQVQVMSMKDDKPYTEHEVITYVYLEEVKGKKKVEGKWSIK